MTKKTTTDKGKEKPETPKTGIPDKHWDKFDKGLDKVFGPKKGKTSKAKKVSAPKKKD